MSFINNEINVYRVNIDPKVMRFKVCEVSVEEKRKTGPS